MKKLLIIFTAVGFFASGCRKIEVDGSTTTATTTSATENTILEGRITENRTLKAQKHV
jgi:hypothetical protein